MPSFVSKSGAHNTTQKDVHFQNDTTPFRVRSAGLVLHSRCEDLALYERHVSPNQWFSAPDVWCDFAGKTLSFSTTISDPSLFLNKTSVFSFWGVEDTFKWKTIELSGIVFDPSLFLCKITVFCFERCWGGFKVKTDEFLLTTFDPTFFLSKTNVFEPRGRWENFGVQHIAFWGLFLTQVFSLAN